MLYCQCSALGLMQDQQTKGKEREREREREIERERERDMVMMSVRGVERERRERLTVIMLKWSSSLSVSRSFCMVLTVMILRRPFILPLVSTRITMFLGELAALMYLDQETTLPSIINPPLLTVKLGN